VSIFLESKYGALSKKTDTVREMVLRGVEGDIYGLKIGYT
jgi:hypothetical protein